MNSYPKNGYMESYIANVSFIVLYSTNIWFYKLILYESAMVLFLAMILKCSTIKHTLKEAPHELHTSQTNFV